MPVTTTKDGMPALLSALKLLNSTRVMVGIPSDAEQPHLGAAPGTEKRASGPIGNATIAYLMEKGSPAANIPPRPSFEPGIEDGRPQIEKYLRAAGDAAMAGDVKRVDQNFHAAGLAGQNAIRAKITSGPFVPLAPATLAARRRRGFRGTSPLIESGQFRQAVSYVLRRTP